VIREDTVTNLYSPRSIGLASFQYWLVGQIWISLPNCSGNVRDWRYFLETPSIYRETRAYLLPALLAHYCRSAPLKELQLPHPSSVCEESQSFASPRIPIHIDSDSISALEMERDKAAKKARFGLARLAGEREIVDFSSLRWSA
jgi:hypothetical protein